MLSDLLQTIQISVKSLVSLWCGGFAICGAVVFWRGAATILYGFVVFAWIIFGGRTVCCRFLRVFTRLCCCGAF